MELDGLTIVAGVGALAHLAFAYRETLGWGRGFVERAAGAWIDRTDPQGTDAHIAWAKRLAFNMGVYNLVLAIGLAWTAVADAGVRGSLGVFFSVWLLLAAAAAAYTQIYKAFLLQGALGLALLIASRWAS